MEAFVSLRLSVFLYHIMPVLFGLVPFYSEALFLLLAGHGTKAPRKTEDAS